MCKCWKLFLANRYDSEKKFTLHIIKECYKKTNTPPLFLLATFMPLDWQYGTLHSTQGFWWRPMTTQGELFQRRSTDTPLRSLFSYSQSSRARLWKMFSDFETITWWWTEVFETSLLKHRKNKWHFFVLNILKIFIIFFSV